MKSLSATRLGPVGSGFPGGAAEVGAAWVDAWVVDGAAAEVAVTGVGADEVVAVGRPDGRCVGTALADLASALAIEVVPSRTADGAAAALPPAGPDITRYVAVTPPATSTTAAAAASSKRGAGRRGLPRSAGQPAPRRGGEAAAARACPVRACSSGNRGASANAASSTGGNVFGSIADAVACPGCGA